jgi:VWFA-related protein
MNGSLPSDALLPAAWARAQDAITALPRYNAAEGVPIEFRAAHSLDGSCFLDLAQPAATASTLKRCGTRKSERGFMTVPASPRIQPATGPIRSGEPARPSPDPRFKAKELILFCRPIAGILFLACALVARAQSAPGPQTTKKSPAVPPATEETIHVASPLVVVPFTAESPKGGFVYDLKQREVQVLDNGVPQQISHFGLATQPIAAVIVVQANSNAAPFLKSVHPLGVLISGLLLGSNGRAAVLGYADDVTTLQPFSADPAKLNKALQHIKPEGSKARLNDALARAVRMLSGQAKAERRVIIVFSDGHNRGSAARGEQVVRAACDANIQIYALRFQPGREAFQNNEKMLSQSVYPAQAPPGGPASVRGGQPVLDFGPAVMLTLKVVRAQLRKNMLATYSVYTGGSVYTPLKTRRFQDALQQIALDINSEYTLTYVPSTLKEEGFHRIQVELTRPQLKVHTRSGYFNEMPASGM